MRFFIYFLVSLVYSSLSFLLSSYNAVYSLLFLICLFLLGTVLLFLINVTFLGLIFFMIYIGAIVVLFLFVIMMLDIKSNIIQKTGLEQSPISIGNVTLIFIFINFFFLTFEDISVVDLLNTYDTLKIVDNSFTF
jgi:NADH-quinone oxidoreductase subunit J